jgi:hypothetical protein
MAGNPSSQKEPQKVPRDLVADEKLTRVVKQQVYVPTTVGGGCFLGVSVVEAADTVTLERGDGAFAKEAKALVPEYQARSVCTDGWEATRQAWRQLFPKITLVLCFLHSILKMKKHCTGQLGHQVLDRAWQVYQAATNRQFAQRLRRGGRVDAVAPQRTSRHDGVKDVPPSGRLHPSLGLSTGVPHLQCGRSAAQLSRPTALRYALLARHHQQRALGRTGHGAAMELSPVWRTPAAGPASAGVSL